MITIDYFAKRKLKGGVNVGDNIIIEIPVESFSPIIVVDNSVSTAIGGNPQVSLKHFYESWSINTVFDEVNSQGDYEQFLFSVLGGVPFIITDYDHSDTPINVIMTATFGKTPIRRFNAGEFTYSFTVREI